MLCSWIGIAGHTQKVEDESYITGEFAACGGYAVAALGLDQPDLVGRASGKAEGK